MDMNEFHRVDDMSVVAFLRMHNYTPQSVEYVDGQCSWYFRVSDGLMDQIDVYSSGEARIEPRAYNREFKQVRAEMFSAKDRQVESGNRR